MASSIETYLNQIINAVYGREVRSAIHDGIKECYDDVTNSKTIADAAAETAELASKNLPYVGSNGNWFIWDAEKAAYADSGESSKGPSGTVKIGTVTTGTAGSSAAVTNSGTETAAVLDFTIPTGPTGPTGPIATVSSYKTEYQTSTSGTTVPSGTWSTSVTASKGSYLWTRTTVTFSNNKTIYIYSVAYQGMDGSGAVTKVNGYDGNVTLTASDVGAIATTAGAVGSTNLAASAVTNEKLATGAVTTAKLASAVRSVAKTATIDVSSWSSKAVTITVNGVTTDNNVIVSPDESSREVYLNCGVRCTEQAANQLIFKCDETPTAALTVNVLIINV